MVLAVGVVIALGAVAAATFSRASVHRPYLFAGGATYLILLGYGAVFDWAVGGGALAISGVDFAIGGGLVLAEGVLALSRWSGSQLRLRRTRVA